MKLKKRIKGMTLIEIIISIAVLAIMGTIMARIATASCSMMKESNHLNRKTEAQSPLSGSADVSAGVVMETNISVSISGPFDASSVRPITAVKYSANVDPTAPTDSMNANLYYYDVQIETETETETTPPTT